MRVPSIETPSVHASLVARVVRWAGLLLVLSTMAACADAVETTDEGTGAVVTETPLTAANWKTHPKIVEITKLADNVDGSFLRAKTRQSDRACSSEIARDADTDDAGTIGMINLRIVLDKSIVNHVLYFDAAGHVRLVKVIEVTDQAVRQWNVYFDEQAARLWEVLFDGPGDLPTILKGPGKVVDEKASILPTVLKDTVFLDAQGKPRADALAQPPAAIFQAPFGCAAPAPSP